MLRSFELLLLLLRHDIVQSKKMCTMVSTAIPDSHHKEVTNAKLLLPLVKSPLLPTVFQQLYTRNSSRDENTRTSLNVYHLIYPVFQKKTPTHIIGYKLRNSCLMLIILTNKIPLIIRHRMTA